MKTTAIAIILSVILYSFTFSFSTHKSENTLRANEDRNVPSFTKIDLGVPATLFFELGEKQKVSIDAESDILKEIETEVKGNTLEIKFKSWHFKPTGKITINITVPAIEGLDVSGSGYIEGKGKINSKSLKLDVSGSGKIKIADLSATDIKTDISGSGKVELGGSDVISSHKIDISGSGAVSASDLQVESVKASISGSGNCRVFVKQTLHADISGSGHIYYKGSPKVNANISGSGKVTTMD
jgi:hypothetical protein